MATGRALRKGVARNYDRGMGIPHMNSRRQDGRATIEHARISNLIVSNR